MTKRSFQGLAALHQLLLFAATVVQSMTDAWLPPEMRSFLGVESSVLDEAAHAGPSDYIEQSLWWGLTLASILASAGLVLFRPWGRVLFALVSAAWFVLIP